MVETGNNCYNLNEKYDYLKANSIRCRTKNLGVVGMGMGIVSVGSVSLDVYYKDMERAQQLLSTVS